MGLKSEDQTTDEWLGLSEGDSMRKQDRHVENRAAQHILQSGKRDEGPLRKQVNTGITELHMRKST